MSHLDRFQEELIRGAVEDIPTLGARFELMTEAAMVTGVMDLRNIARTISDVLLYL